MAALVVNIVLILAVLVLAAAWLVGAARGRRQGRRQHAEERKLIVQAFLDAASVATLLDLLEERRAPRRAGLVNGPRGVWAAGARAGQQVGRRTLRERGTPASDDATTGPELYRAAAAELVDIHAHDPHDAQREYRRYAGRARRPSRR